MPSRKEFLTTGEAATILHLSPSTVIRRFEKGDLTGRRHPVTRKRLIARDSILKFMEAHKMAAERLFAFKRRLLAAGADDSDVKILESLVSGDVELEVRSVRKGSEACGIAFQWRPDLIVVDTKLADMDGRDAVRCLRNLPPLKQTKIVLSSGPTVRVTKQELRELGINQHWRRPWQPKNLAGKLHDLLGIQPAAEAKPVPFQHRRRWPRITADWPANLKIALKGQPRISGDGVATVRNISRGGAFLSDIRLDPGGLPTVPFTIEMKINKGEAAGLSAKCKPVRIQTNGGVGMGIEFIRLPSRQAERLSWALGA